MLGALDPSKAAAVMENMDPGDAKNLLMAMASDGDPSAAAAVLANMDPAAAAKVVDTMKAEDAATMLSAMGDAEVSMINSLLD